MEKKLIISFEEYLDTVEKLSVDINNNPSALRYPRGNGIGINLPSIDAEAVSAQVQGTNYNNLTTQQKLDLLFG